MNIDWVNVVSTIVMTIFTVLCFIVVGCLVILFDLTDVLYVQIMVAVWLLYAILEYIIAILGIWRD